MQYTAFWLHSLPYICGGTMDRTHILYSGISAFLSFNSLELASSSPVLPSVDPTIAFLWDIHSYKIHVELGQSEVLPCRAKSRKHNGEIKVTVMRFVSTQSTALSKKHLTHYLWQTLTYTDLLTCGTWWDKQKKNPNQHQKIKRRNLSSLNQRWIFRVAGYSDISNGR